MKRRIRSGQYQFPKPEWTNVSSDCKELIKGCLKTSPEERLTIDQVIGSKWVSQYNTVPPTPLLTTEVLKEETEQWPDVLVTCLVIQLGYYNLDYLHSAIVFMALIRDIFCGGYTRRSLHFV